MKKIGVDLDEILSDTLTSVLEYFNKLYIKSHKKEHFYTYNYWDILGGTKEGSIKFVDDYYKTDYFTNIKPIKDAYRNLVKLKKLGHELYVITGRSETYEKQTRDWVEKHYPDIFSEIFFVNTFSNSLIPIKKSQVCNMNGIKLLIEDNPDYIIDCTDNGVEVLFLDYPWNKGKEFKNATRVYSWDEIGNKIVNL